MTEPDRSVRARSFGAVAEEYDRLRPSPPDDAVAWLVPTTARAVLDLGAGTGAMTRQLTDRERVVAVEPDERMRAVLARRSPDVDVLPGTAADIPLPDESVDAVVVASAWHWMDPQTAVPEIARVLVDGGRFAVIWTGRDPTVDWVRELAFAEPARALQRSLRRLEIPQGSPFEEPERAMFTFTRELTVEDLADSMATYSAVITQGPEAAANTVERVRESLRARFGTDGTIDVPFRALAFRTTRLTRPPEG